MASTGGKMLFGLLALTVAAMFTGAAVYINVAEQPARLTLDDAALLAEWKPAYRHGFAMQAPLAVVGCLFGLIAWWQTGQVGFVAGAVLMIANWPWTILAIMPTNKLLEGADHGTPGTRALIVRWGELHAVRSGLGALATLAFLLSCLAA
jgi:hypothetical protein